MVTGRRYRSASGAPTPASFVFSSRPSAMAHPMLRGAQAAITGSSMIWAASAGPIDVSIVGEAAIQVGNWCARRHPGTPRTRPDNALSIHSITPTEDSMKASPKWNEKLAIKDGTVDLAQSSATVTKATEDAEKDDAQPVPTIDRSEASRLQNIIRREVFCSSGYSLLALRQHH